MLKRNKMLALFLVIAVLCMAIGFAAISDTLYVGGTVNLDLSDGGELDKEFNENVYFVNAMATDSKVTASTIGADEAGDANDKYTFVIDASAFNNVGDSQAITVSVKNDNNVDATLTLSAVAEGALADFITVTPVINTTVAAGAANEMTITVTLDSVPANTATGEISFTIEAVPAN